ncbi:hypothetical protein TIFTF001_052803 [Ficus carica]|uniref:Uncharacterized protein n=1 Tax=Ficus carica TaxID=3494 RepID=A0AA88ECG3_FICCA|nr:hypothetical protein TIFTF001_052803 [Ficus carica]
MSPNYCKARVLTGHSESCIECNETGQAGAENQRTPSCSLDFRTGLTRTGQADLENQRI